MPPRGRAEGALLADKGDRTLLAVGLGVAAHGLGHVGDGGRRSWWRDGRGEALGGAEHSGGVRGGGGARRRACLVALVGVVYLNSENFM
jgi:hypothetical protein